ncbi:oxygen-independent coproporphyrinogen III oxidase [Aurantivibrio plasticivorans]
MQAPSWDPTLIQRHDKSGPRYTSYPTAPQFHEEFSLEQLESAIERSNASRRPLSLYFHIPFCDTICYYCACNKIVTANKSRARPYLDSLFDEMRLMAEKVASDRPVNQLHWGGGTPTYISDDEKRELMGVTRELFKLHEDDTGEYSIEVHPGQMEVGTIGVLRELGFNRISMGIQDFDPLVQRAVNRFNSVEQVSALVSAARQKKFHSISMDLIYGLPMQTLETLRATVQSVIELSPDRISLFNYAHLPHLFKTQKQIDERQLPSADTKLSMLELAITLLTQAGYVYIGMDHFAKPDDELAIAQEKGELQRNFQGYATHGNCDMFAFGVSSISAIDNIYVQNFKDIPTYSAPIASGQLPMQKGLVLSEDDLLRQYVINRLICQFELRFAEIEDKFGINFTQYFATELRELNELTADNLIELAPTHVRVTPQGRLLIRRVCMVFDVYLRQPTKQSFSRII